jgi:hypothetical protein
MTMILFAMSRASCWIKASPQTWPARTAGSTNKLHATASFISVDPRRTTRSNRVRSVRTMYAQCMPDIDLNDDASASQRRDRAAWHKSCLSERGREDKESLVRMADCPTDTPKIFDEAVIRVTFLTIFGTARVRRMRRKGRIRRHS